MVLSIFYCNETIHLFLNSPKIYQKSLRTKDIKIYQESLSKSFFNAIKTFVDFQIEFFIQCELAGKSHIIQTVKFKRICYEKKIACTLCSTFHWTMLHNEPIIK